MVTIKDIAKVAGVSPATVSNVLNKRGNVSYRKICLVENAARQLGYRPSDAASALRSGQVKEIAVVLPTMDSETYTDFYGGVLRAAQEHAYSLALYISYANPTQEKQIIQKLLSSRAEFVIAIPCLANAAARYEALRLNGSRVIFAGRAGQDGGECVSFDMASVGRDLARRVVADGAQRIGLMTDMLEFSDARSLDVAFRKEALRQDPTVQIRSVQTVPAQYLKSAFSFFEGPLPQAIVTTQAEMARQVRTAMASSLPGPLPRIYTLAPMRTLADNDFVRYSVNYREMGYVIAAGMLTGDAAEDMSARLRVAGWEKEQSSLNVLQPTVVNMLCVTGSIANPFNSALKQLSPLLKKDLGIELNVVGMNSDELSNVMQFQIANRMYDLVRLDMAMLDEIGPRMLLPLSALDLDVDSIRRRILPGLWGEFTTVDGVDCAVPGDASAMMLFYRRDLLEDAALQRAFLERYHSELKAPVTYEEWIRQCAFFTRASNEESRTPYGTDLSRRATEQLAHLVAESPDRTLDDLEHPAFLKALKDHMRLSELAIPDQGSRSWSMPVANFSNRECMSVLVYANYAERFSASPLSSVSGRVGYAMAPGGCPLLGGGVLGVHRESRQTAAAADLLSWIYSPRISRLLALISGTSPCTFAYEDDQLLDIYPWLSIVRQSFEKGVRRGLFTRPHPGRDLLSLERIIGFYAMNAMNGVIPPEEALHQAAQALDGGAK